MIRVCRGWQTAGARGGIALAIAFAARIGVQSPAAAPLLAQQPVTVTYHAGWNLVGVPDATDLSAVQGDVYGLAADGSSYIPVAVGATTVGEGYWAYFPVETQVSLPQNDTNPASIDATGGNWILVGNPSTSPVRVSGAAAAYSYDPVLGYAQVVVLPPGRGAMALADSGGSIALTPVVNALTLVSPPAPTPAPAVNQFTAGAVSSQPSAAGPDAADAPGVEVVESGFGQAKSGALVAVAAVLQNTGAASDGATLSITVYDAGGSVIAAGDTTVRYLGAGATTGFVHRLTVLPGSLAARIAVFAQGGKPAGDPPPGRLDFASEQLSPRGTGSEASAAIFSSFGNDLTDVHVSAISYDPTGAIDGGGETVKRLIPAGESVGVVLPIDASGTPASVQFFAQLP